MDETPREPEGVEHELRARALATEERGEPKIIPPATPPLRRRANGRMVAGVAGGLADRLRIPAWVVRIPFGFAAFVDATLLWHGLDGGSSRSAIAGVGSRIAVFGILAGGAYVLLWWVVPREDLGVSPVRRGVRRFAISPVRSFAGRYPGVRSWPALALLAFGGALLADQLGIWDPIVALAIAFIAIGLMLYRREPSSTVAADRHVGSAAPSPAPSHEEIEPSDRPSRRERSPFGWITFGSALLAGSIAAVALQLRAGGGFEARYGPIDRISTPPAVALLVLGAGMLVASVYGRARWVVVPAVLVASIMLAASAIRLPLEGRYGDTSVNVHPEDEGVGQRSVAGKVFMDYSSFAGRGDIQRFVVNDSTVFGDVTIMLPYDASFTARAYTGVGTILIAPGTSANGVEISRTTRFRSPLKGGPSFVIAAEAGIGSVSVELNFRTAKQAREFERAQHEAA